jgi:hypothetical protein
MSLFVFSVIAGLVFHQLISIIQPERGLLVRAGGRRARAARILIGRRIILWMPERTYLAAKATSVAVAALLFLLAVTLIVTQGVHPTRGYAVSFADALKSPGLAAAVFGALVGVLAGNVINRVLRAPDNYVLTSSDWLKIVLIGFLFILGIGGEEMIRSSMARISKISVGATTEIAFSDASTKTSMQPAEQAGNALKSVGNQEIEYLRTGRSSGLFSNASLGETIARDQKYLDLLNKYEKGPKFGRDPQLNATEKLVRSTIAPFSACLEGIFVRSANAAFVNTELEKIVDVFLGLASPGDKGDFRGAFVRDFGEAMRDVAEKAYKVGLKDLFDKTSPVAQKKVSLTTEEKQFMVDCTPMVSLLCAPLDPDPLEKPTNKPWLDPKLRKE